MGKDFCCSQQATYLLKERNNKGKKCPPEVSWMKEIDPLFNAEQERMASVVRILPFEERLLESDLPQDTFPFQLLR